MPGLAFITLGAYGDIVNALPLARHLSTTEPVDFIASHQYADILDGVTYVTKRAWSRPYDTLPEAIRYCERRYKQVVVAQAHKHPDGRRLTDSFCKEAWRHAGHLDLFGSLPLVFDRRDRVREAGIRRGRVLFAGNGVSSPFPRAAALLDRLRRDFDVVDLGEVRASRIYDILGVMDDAACLVTVDTAHLHMARASTCPVVAILQDRDGGWYRSVPPPQTVATHEYSTTDVEAVANDVQSVLNRSTGVFIHAADVHGDSPRHRRAWDTWPSGIYEFPEGRSAADIGDPVRLPYMRDLLEYAIAGAADNDVVCLTNDDTGFVPGAIDKILRHCSVWEFGVCQRDTVHKGRDAFAFRVGWLRANIGSMPDVFLSRAWGDLAVLRWLRAFRGIVTTMDNLGVALFPVDIDGCIVHEPHESSWLAAEGTPSARWNADIWNANRLSVERV